MRKRAAATCAAFLLAGLATAQNPNHWQNIWTTADPADGTETMLLQLTTGTCLTGPSPVPSTCQRYVTIQDIADFVGGISDTFLAVELDGVPISTAAPTINFLGSDFVVVESPADDFALSISGDLARDTELHVAVVLAGTPDYILAGGPDNQTLTLGLIDLATDITGSLTLAGDVSGAHGANQVDSVQPNSVALTTDTTGNYAAGDGEAGNATSLAADALNAMAEIAAGIKRGPDATDTHLLTTDVAPAAGARCLEMDTDGSVILGADTCVNLGPGEANTGSNLGGGLANFSLKVGVDLRFNSFAAVDFDLAANVFTIDAAIARDSELHVAATLAGVPDYIISGGTDGQTFTLGLVDLATDVAGSLPLAGDVDGAHGANDLDEAAVKAELEAVLLLQNLQGAVTDGQVPDSITAALYALLTGATLSGTFDFNDGVGDSPPATFTPQTGTAWSIAAIDVDDDLRITPASSASDEAVEIINPGTGLAELFIETSDGVLTDVKDAGSLVEGTVPAARVGADHVDAMSEIAAAIKRGPDATDTHLLTTDVAAPGALTCLEMDTDGSVTLAGGACGAGGTPTLDAVLDPAAAADFVFGAISETLRFDFESAFTTGVQALFESSLGNPTGGILVGINAHDADVTPFTVDTSGGEAFRVHKDGNLGVDVTTPLSPIHVRAGGGDDLLRFEENVGGQAWRFQLGAAGLLSLTSDTGVAMQWSHSDRLVIFREEAEHQGNVSILAGNNPIDPLHVQADSGTDAIRIEEFGAGTEHYKIRISAAGDLDFENDASVVALKLYDATADVEVTSGNLAVLSGDLSVKSGVDSVTAVQVLDLDGGAPVFNVDTLNERVGLGTSTPDRALDVEGSGDVSIETESTTSGNAADEFTSAGVSVFVGRLPTSGGGSGTLDFYNSGVRMVIEPSGDIGVGTNNPLVGFHVVGDQTRLAANETDDANKFTVLAASQYDTSAEAEGYTLIHARSDISSNGVRLGGSTAGQNAATFIDFHTAADVTTRTGTRRGLIDSEGDWAIGNNSAPETNLHITENNTETLAAVRIDQAGTGDAALAFEVAATTWIMGIDNGTSDQFSIAKSTALGSLDAFSIDLGRHIGMTKAPGGARLAISQGSSEFLPVLLLDQNDGSDVFINYEGTSSAGGSNSISSDTTEDSAKAGAFRVEINGTVRWIRFYDNES